MSRNDNRDYSGSVEQYTPGTFNAGPMGMSRDDLHDHYRAEHSGTFDRAPSFSGANGYRAQGTRSREEHLNEMQRAQSDGRLQRGYDGQYRDAPRARRTRDEIDPFESERALGRYQAFQSDEEHHQHHEGLGEQLKHGWEGLKESFAGKGPKNYVRSDGRIHEECCEHLAHDSFVDASDVDVTVTGGEVTLTGTVDSKEQKRRAEVVIEHLRGVHDVHNQLRVRRTEQTSFATRPL